MTDVEDGDSDTSTDPMTDRRSPPIWDGPPPVFNLLDAIRHPISTEALFECATLRFDADLLMQNDGGEFCVPLPIAAPMLVLRDRLEEELTSMNGNNFLLRLEFPTFPRANPPEIVEDLLSLLLQATSLEECQHYLANASTRVVFEVVVDLVQRVQSLRVPISYQTARAMLDVELMRHRYGSLNEIFQQPITEAAFVNLITQEVIEADAFKRRIPNILHYLWFQDLQAFTNEGVKLVFQFLLVNFMHLLRMICIANNATIAGVEDGPFMVIDYAQMHVETLEETLRVLGIKLGKYLISAPPAFNQAINQTVGLDGFSEAVTSGKFLVNLLILNQQSVWLPAASLESFINHDQPNCNFQSEQCICRPFRVRFPEAVEGLTTPPSDAANHTS